MVKTLTLVTEIHGCSVQGYFDSIYQDNRLLQIYHKQVNLDDSVQISPWEDGKRVISFTMVIAIPASIRRIVGVEAIRVHEHQKYNFNANGEITISSTPILEVPGGSKFTTAATTVLKPCSTGDCQVSTVVDCEACLPWPLQATVEGIMAEQARSSVAQFLDYCKRWCRENSAVANSQLHQDVDQAADFDLVAPLPAPMVSTPMFLPLPAGSKSPASAAEVPEGEDDFFFDASDVAQPALRSSEAATGAAEAGELEQLRLELQQLRATLAHTNSLLEQLVHSGWSNGNRASLPAFGPRRGPAGGLWSDILCTRVLVAAAALLAVVNVVRWQAKR